MWITVFLVCFTVIFSCSAQVTNSDIHTVTETARANQDVEWDTTGPSVTLSIKDGRSDNANVPRNEISNQPLFYSNQWQPFLMPIGFNNYGDVINRQNTEDEEGINYQFMPTFLRRPDSDLNRTSSSPFTQLSNGYRNPFVPLPIPVAPINPMFFYPQQQNLFPNGNFREAVIASVLQNSSAATSGPTVITTEASSLSDAQERIVPSPAFAAIPNVQERFHPINFYRNREDILPPTPPAFAPSYPLVPNSNDNSLHPVVFPFLNSHLFDREAGSDVVESLSGRQDIPGSETPVTPNDVGAQESIVANGTPSDSSTFVPPEPLPVPAAGFPFGLLPPPIFPPIVPGPAATGGFPLNPLAEHLMLGEDGIVRDSLLPQPPLSANLPPLESPPSVLSPVNGLESEAELSATIQNTAETTLPIDKPSEAKIPYEFGFDMNDGQGTDQHRKEVSDVSGTVRGSYGYRDLFGVYRFVNYIADKNGFRAFIKSNEPGVASSGSADVVVMAEHPPPAAIAEGEKTLETEAVIVPDTVTDLVAEGSETVAK